MSIPFPVVGAIIDSTFVPDTVNDAINAINTVLLAAGWLSDALFGSVTLTITIPGNGTTCIIAGVTYTFQTTLNNSVANNIKIASTAALQAQNIADALSAVSGGGTEWSTPTVANPLVTATATGASLLITANNGGASGSTSFSVTGFGNGASQGNGFVCQCPQTPQGLQANVYIMNTQPSPNIEGQTISIWPGSADGTLQAGALVVGGGNGGASGFFGSLTITSAYTLRIIANAHMFFIYLPGSKNTQGTEIGMLVPFLRAGQTPLQIANVSAAIGGQIQITTMTAHGLTTGVNVSMYGILGTIPGVNGVFTVTVIDSTNYYLNGTTFSGTYSSGGLVGGAGGAGAPGGISRCFVAWWDFSWVTGQSGHKNTWRNGVTIGQGYYCVNENAYGQVGGSANLGQALYTQPRNGGAYLCWGNISNVQECQIGWPGTSSGSVFRSMGEIWGSMILADSVPMDTQITGYLSHNWVNMTDLDGEAALFIAIS